MPSSVAGADERNVLLVSSRYGLWAYLAGATIARTADEMSAPALLLLGLAMTGSAQTGSLLYAGLTVSGACGGPLLGAFLDRSERPGRLLAWTLAGYAAGLTVITVSLGRVPTAAVVGVAVLAGLLAPALAGGWTSRLADAVPAAAVTRGYSLDAATYSAAALAGPALAGLVAAAAGADWAMAAVTALLLLATPAAWRLPGPAARRPAPGQVEPAAQLDPAAPTLSKDLLAGLRVIIRNRALLRVTVCSMLAYLGSAMLVVACPLLGRRYLGDADRGALLLSVLAAASLATNAVVSRWPSRYSPDTIFAAGLAVAAVGYVGLVLAPGTGWVIATIAVIGAAEGRQIASMFAIRHREAPRRLHAQVFTTAASLKISAGAAGAALAGQLAGQSTGLVLMVAATAQFGALVAYAVLTRMSPPPGPDLRSPSRAQAL
jgi:MFS family permease